MKKRMISDLAVGSRLVFQNRLYVVIRFEDGLAHVTRADDGAQRWWAEDAFVDALDTGECWPPAPAPAVEGSKVELSPLSAARADLRHMLNMQKHCPEGASDAALNCFLHSVCDMVEDYLDRRQGRSSKI